MTLLFPVNFPRACLVCALHLLVLLLLPFPSTASPQHTWLINKVQGIVLTQAEVFLDTSATGSVSGYRSAQQINPSPGAWSPEKNIGTVAWLKFLIINTADSTRAVLLDLPWADSLICHLSYRNSDSLKVSGKKKYNPEHIFFDQRRTVKVYVGARDTIEAVVKVVKGGKMKDLFVETALEDEFIQRVAFLFYKHRQFTTPAILFFGMLLFQLLFIIVQGLFSRRIEYMYYLLYALSIGLYYLLKYETTLNWTIFFNYFTRIGPEGINVLLFIPYFFYYRFARYYCDIGSMEPSLAKKIRLAEKIILLYCMVVVIADMYLHSPEGMRMLLLSGAVCLFFASIYLLVSVYRLHNNLARILVSGSVIALFTSTTANIASYTEWLYHLLPLRPVDFAMVGIIIEMVVFNAGLVFKARQLERESRRAQENLLKEMAEKRNLVLQNIEERDRIAADLHDDIGATLSSISIYSDSASQKLKLGDTQRALKLLEQIGAGARATMSNMSDIVWTINPGNDDIRHLIDKMESFAVPLLQSKGILLNLHQEGLQTDRELAPGIRKCIFLIFKEVINNSVKYSGAGNITVSLSEQDDTLHMTISDNGCGFDPEIVKQGNGLRNIRNRARESGGELMINSGKGGTVISLKIPL